MTQKNIKQLGEGQIKGYPHLIMIKTDPSVRPKAVFLHPDQDKHYEYWLVEHYSGVYTEHHYEDLLWLGNPHTPATSAQTSELLSTKSHSGSPALICGFTPHFMQKEMMTHRLVFDGPGGKLALDDHHLADALNKVGVPMFKFLDDMAQPHMMQNLRAGLFLQKP